MSFGFVSGQAWKGRFWMPTEVAGLIIGAGERSYVLVGEWPGMEDLAGARTRMIETLGTFRHALEDLGTGLGVTDAVSGEVVLSLK